MFPTNVFCNIGHCPWANWLWLTAHYVKRCISVKVINGNGATSDSKKNLGISGLVSRGFQVPLDTSDLVDITSTDIYGLLGFTLFLSFRLSATYFLCAKI